MTGASNRQLCAVAVLVHSHFIWTREKLLQWLTNPEAWCRARR